MKRFLRHNAILIVSFPTFSRKGRTITKVMHGGRGIFEPPEFFFVIKFLV